MRAIALAEGPASPRDHRRGVLAVAFAGVLLSTGALFIKAVGADALTITMWRSLFAAPTILVFVRVPVRFPWRAGGATLLAAGSYALMLLFFVAAARLTTAANAIFLQFTAPLYVAVLAPRLLREPASRLDIITLTAALVGMALFFVGRFDAPNLVGSLFGLAAGAAFATLLLSLRARSMTRASRLEAVIFGNLALVAVLAVVNLARDASGAFAPGATDLVRMLYLGIVQVGLAYVIYGYGIARVPALEASLVNMVEPVLNPLWVFLVLAETPGWWAVPGGAIILMAIGTRALIVEGRSKRSRAASLAAGLSP